MCKRFNAFCSISFPVPPNFYPLLSFHAVTKCKFSNSFFLIFIRVMGGYTPSQRFKTCEQGIFQLGLDLSLFVSEHCALFYSMDATYPQWNQCVPRSFHRHGGWGCYGELEIPRRRTFRVGGPHASFACGGFALSCTFRARGSAVPPFKAEAFLIETDAGGRAKAKTRRHQNRLIQNTRPNR